MSRRPTPALIVATIALIVALGGTSYAALRIGSGQIVNNSIRSADVHNGTLLRRDFAQDTLPSSGTLDPYQVSTNVNLTPGATGSAVAECPARHAIISGGYQFGQHRDVRVFYNGPQDGRRWIINATNAGEDATTVTAFAYCVPN